MASATAGYGTYRKVNIETASQGKLILMMFNGAIQRAEEAKRQMLRRHMTEAHNNLIRAQEIVGELRGALNMEAGDVARNLDRVYEYFQHLLVQANIRKDTAPIDECVTQMTVVRDTWRQLFDTLGDRAPAGPPQIDPHGSALLNCQG